MRAWATLAVAPVRWLSPLGSIVGCIILAGDGRYAAAVLALLWSFIGGFIGFPARIAWALTGRPRKLEDIQNGMRAQLVSER